MDKDLLKSNLLANIFNQVVGTVDGEVREHFGKDGCAKWDESDSDNRLYEAIKLGIEKALK